MMANEIFGYVFLTYLLVVAAYLMPYKGKIGVFLKRWF